MSAEIDVVLLAVIVWTVCLTKIALSYRSPNERVLREQRDELIDVLEDSVNTLHTWRDEEKECLCSQCEFVRRRRAVLAKVKSMRS